MKASAAAVKHDPVPVAEARPALDGAERAVLQGRIRAEIAQRRPRPVALRTLELLAAASVEPVDSELGYRVVDRLGAPRLRTIDGAEPAPMVLADLLDALQAQHPALFLPPEPPAPPPEPEVAQESALMAAASEVRAATTRFVEAQSERAHSLAERSSVQGKALAQSAAGRFAGLRSRLSRRVVVPPTPQPVSASLPESASEPTTPNPHVMGSNAPPVASNRKAAAASIGDSVRDRINQLRDYRPAGWSASHPDHLHRRWLAGASAAVVIAVVAAGLVIATRSPPGDGTQAPQREKPVASAPVVPEVPPSPAGPAETPAPDTASPPPEIENRAGADVRPVQPDAPAANAITGPAQVIDTATLRVNGKVMRLFGVEWVRGGQADDLTKYLAGRPVSCQGAPGSENVLCQVEGRDLSEVVLFNGGGRASPEATPDLVAAEDHARTERIGVWKR